MKFKDIAIDDVRVLNSCPPKVGSSCDFETPDLCGYTNVTGEIYWKWGMGSALPVPGPTADQ